MNPIKKISTKIFELGSKKRDLEIEINTLKLTHERESQNVLFASESARELQSRIFHLGETIEKTENLGLDVITKVNECIDRALDTFREVGNAAEKTLSFVKQLEILIDKRSGELLEIDKENEKKLENVKLEEHRLSVLKSDLDIYKNRLQKK